VHGAVYEEYWLVSWPDDDPSLGSKLVTIQIELFASELVMTEYV
jgi:hypothetical protein